MGYLMDKIFDDIRMRDIVIWGAGKRGHNILNYMDPNWKKGLCFVDNKWDEYNKCEGYDVCPPASLKGKNVFIIVTPLYECEKIFTQLNEMGFRQNIDYIYYDSFLYAYLEDNHRKETRENPYGSLFMPAAYIPWVEDDIFDDACKIANKYSLCGRAKLNYIWRMVGEACKLNQGIFVEVGTWRGGSGCIIAKKVEAENNDGDVYLCDTFTGVVKAGEMDDCYNGGEHADTDISIVKGLIDEMNLKNVKILQGIFPEDTGDEIVGKKIAFAHVDVDVYQSTKDIINYIWPMIIPGGIVVFDDYGTPTTKGQKKYIDEVKNISDRIFIANMIGQGIFIKK